MRGSCAGRRLVSSGILFARDQRVLRRYIDEWRSPGEIAAVACVSVEVERLTQVSGHGPCSLELPSLFE